MWPTCAEQRCWVHKTANVLNKLPKSQQPKAKRALQDIWMAATRKDAEKAFRSEADKGNDPNLQAWSSQNLKSIQSHLKMAQELQAGIGK